MPAQKLLTLAVNSLLSSAEFTGQDDQSSKRSGGMGIGEEWPGDSMIKALTLSSEGSMNGEHPKCLHTNTYSVGNK